MHRDDNEYHLLWCHYQTRTYTKVKLLNSPANCCVFYLFFLNDKLQVLTITKLAMIPDIFFMGFTF